MLQRIIFSFALFLSATSHGVQRNIPRYDLEMTGLEWEQVLAQRTKPMNNSAVDPLNEVIAFGKRNLDWLRFINDSRTDKISLTDPTTTKGIPIESPKEYSDQTVLADYREVLRELPPSMQEVLVNQKPFTADPGVSIADYIKWGHKVDVVYQTAARWQSMMPWLNELQMQKSQDARGYYFLSRETDRDARLANFANLPVDVKANYTLWLIADCMNGYRDESTCQAELNAAEAAGTVTDFYNKYWRFAVTNWESFFVIPANGKFPSVMWTSAEPSVAVVPFANTGDQAQQNFLTTNIEDEWKWTGWNLRLDFKSNAKIQVNVHWEPGIVPHVDDLGSPEIYMDSNAPLSEYDVQWTIRHEFGHVLGFPDCYLEFYDPIKKVIVSYQHDVTNLMCSRRGHLKQTHFDEMKRVYFQ